MMKKKQEEEETPVSSKHSPTRFYDAPFKFEDKSRTKFMFCHKTDT